MPKRAYGPYYLFNQILKWCDHFSRSLLFVCREETIHCLPTVAYASSCWILILSVCFKIPIYTWCYFLNVYELFHCFVSDTTATKAKAYATFCRRKFTERHGRKGSRAVTADSWRLGRDRLFKREDYLCRAMGDVVLMNFFPAAIRIWYHVLVSCHLLPSCWEGILETSDCQLWCLMTHIPSWLYPTSEHRLESISECNEKHPIHHIHLYTLLLRAFVFSMWRRYVPMFEFGIHVWGISFLLNKRG